MNPSNTASSALKKLSLKKETLRRLTSPELQLAVGGARAQGSYPDKYSVCMGCE